MSVKGAKPRILAFGTIERGGLTFTFVALSICLLCVSPIAITQDRKSKFGLLNGLAMNEVKLGGRRNLSGRSYWSQKQSMAVVIKWLKDNFKSFFNHGEPDWEGIRERVKLINKGR